MSLPRQILPDATHFLTRRCAHRQFLLRPDPLLNHCVLYCIAVAAQRTGVLFHAFCVMSNHWHAVLTDPHARLPECMAWAHGYIARCLNLHHHRSENLWDPREYSAVALEHPDDVLDKMVYVLSNPVQAELVPRATDWPGVHSARLAFGGPPLEVSRPPVYFRADGTAPDTASLALVRPPQFAHLSDADFSRMLHDRLAHVEQLVHSRLQAHGRRFLGPRRCLNTRPTDRPKNPEPRPALSPRVAARDAELRKAMLARRRDFVAAYRDAFERWRDGDRNVQFPPGTDWMRLPHRVRCRAPT